MNIIQRQSEICSGCGVCETVCPNNCISIKENEYGELRPVLVQDACISCGLCTKVCPFEEEIDTETKEEKCYVAVSNQFHSNGSSGGVVTWLLTALLEKRYVDSVVCVKPQNDSEKLFTYTICHSQRELVECQGSAYYPVTVGEVLKRLTKESGRIAVIGIPCFVTAIQKLRNTKKSWKDKIRFVFGLVCGHMPSKMMTDCLAWANGCQRDDISACRFRIRGDNKPAWNYGVRLTYKDGQSTLSYGSDDFGYLFWRRLFIQDCCTQCRDVFASHADITFMDAWLPEYKDKSVGTSMVICRNSELDIVLQKLKEEGTLIEVNKDKVIEAQAKAVKYKEKESHPSDIDLRNKVRLVCGKYRGQQNIIDELRRMIYKEELKKKNKPLWMLMEIKDRLRTL